MCPLAPGRDVPCAVVESCDCTHMHVLARPDAWGTYTHRACCGVLGAPCASIVQTTQSMVPKVLPNAGWVSGATLLTISNASSRCLNESCKLPPVHSSSTSHTCGSDAGGIAYSMYLLSLRMQMHCT